METFSFEARGRRYTVATEALGTAISNPNSVVGYWLYQPSVLLPSPVTNNQHVLVINRNRFNGNPQLGQAIYRYTSATPTNFGNEWKLLENNSVDNICDMICARPIWDGSLWHVYVQAREGDLSTCCTCGGNILANIYEAVGPSLDPPTVLEWVKVPGTNSAKPIISGTGDRGIGEEMQWYNPSRYGLSNFPFMVTYNDWGCASIALCAQDVFNYISQDDVTYSYWYGPEPKALMPPPFSDPTYSFGLIWPDGILLGDLDVARLGVPGIGFSSQCFNTDRRYQYCYGIGFFNNPTKVPHTSPQTSSAHVGALEAWGQPVPPDPIGPRMFRPKVARNEYGYIPPRSYHGYPRTWETYLYYTYTQIEENPSSSCNGYSAWDDVVQSIGVSRLTITEEATHR